MHRMPIVVAGLLMLAAPTVAAAQRTAALAKPAAGAQVFITLKLTRDETWVYEPATGDVTACCTPVKGVGVVIKGATSRTAAPATAPAPQQLSNPIPSIGVVVKKNGPPYPTARVAPPRSGPAPADAVNPIKGVGIVVKRNPGTSAERSMSSAADGSAMFDGAMAPGTYDVTVSIPADALPDGASKAAVSLPFRITVGADGAIVSGFLSKKGYAMYSALAMDQP